MPDLRTQAQLVTILAIIDRHGWSNVEAYNRVTAIVGRPVPSTWATLTQHEADLVIDHLGGHDAIQPQLPIPDVPSDRIEGLIADA